MRASAYSIGHEMMRCLMGIGMRLWVLGEDEAMRNDLRAPAGSKFSICEFGISRKAFQGLSQSLNVEADG